jgi:hypothetical protein
VCIVADAIDRINYIILVAVDGFWYSGISFAECTMAANDRMLKNAATYHSGTRDILSLSDTKADLVLSYRKARRDGVKAYGYAR